MAKYGLSYADMGRIIPNKITGQPMSYQTFSTKINKEFNFDARNDSDTGLFQFTWRKCDSARNFF